MGLTETESPEISRKNVRFFSENPLLFAKDGGMIALYRTYERTRRDFHELDKRNHHVVWSGWNGILVSAQRKGQPASLRHRLVYGGSLPVDERWIAALAGGGAGDAGGDSGPVLRAASPGEKGPVRPPQDGSAKGKSACPGFSQGGFQGLRVTGPGFLSADT